MSESKLMAGRWAQRRQDTRHPPEKFQHVHRHSVCPKSWAIRQNAPKYHTTVLALIVNEDVSMKDVLW